MLAVVLKQEDSVYAAVRRVVGEIQVSDQSVYNKLHGMELGVSATLVQNSTQRLAEVIDALDVRLTPWVPGYGLMKIRWF